MIACNVLTQEEMMESRNDLEESIIQFVTEWTKCRKPIHAQTLLVDDLGIWGDDGDDFLIDFCKRFNIETYGFPVGKYFGYEGFSIIDSFIDLGRTLKGEPTQQPQLTITDLIKAARNGKFDADIMKVEPPPLQPEPRSLKQYLTDWWNWFFMKGK